MKNSRFSRIPHARLSIFPRYPKTSVFEYLRILAMPWGAGGEPFFAEMIRRHAFFGNRLENAGQRPVSRSGSETCRCPAFSPRLSGSREHPRRQEPQIRRQQKSTREKQGRSVVLTCVPSSSFTARYCAFEYALNVCTFSTYLAVLAPAFLFRAAPRLFSKRG